jgi:hypothetical protein
MSYNHTEALDQHHRTRRLHKTMCGRLSPEARQASGLQERLIYTYKRREMSFATTFCSGSRFFASDLSYDIAERNTASKVQDRTILPAKFMLERLLEAYFI